MAIPESQLTTWSHQGSITQSSDTYETVKRALEAANTKYAGKGYEVFLQGSYCNDTNIYAESDVDIVIRLNVTYYYELSALDPQGRAAFQAAFIPATYRYADFKSDVIEALQASFPSAVHAGPNAIKIDGAGNRRNSDVLVAADYRNYRAFPVGTNGVFPHAICFFNGASNQVVNYPKLHSKNCTTKHQATHSWFKPMVRILKNTRSKLETDGFPTFSPVFSCEVQYDDPTLFAKVGESVSRSGFLSWCPNTDRFARPSGNRALALLTRHCQRVVLRGT